PRVAVRIGEHAGVAAPERRAGRARDRRAGALGVGQHRVDLLGRADVVRERHSAPAAAVLDAAVLGELCAPPEREDGAAGPEEDDVVVRCGAALPAERLVEAPRPPEVRDSERDEAETLLHMRWRGLEPPRGINPTRPSTLRVYQFRHQRARAIVATTSRRPPLISNRLRYGRCASSARKRWRRPSRARPDTR